MSAPALPLTGARTKNLSAGGDSITAVGILDGFMRSLASLKLTVVLFALAIFIVLVGTLAQTESDINQVVRNYFHAFIMWVDINILIPPSFWPKKPHITFPLIPFPGGMSVGIMMVINLIAAHGWRFTVQTKGVRLLAGIGVIVFGLLMAFLIILAGHNSQGFQAKPPFSWQAFWGVFLFSVSIAWLGGVAACLYSAVMAFKKPAVPLVEIVGLSLVALLLLAIGVAIGFGIVARARPSDEALRIVWQLVQGGLAGLILLGGSILVFKKRGGMVLLHAGIGLLMFNELWVAMTARERQVFMQEGQTVNYLRDIRTIELALIDRSDKETDEHVVVPRELLERNFRANSKRKSGQPLVFIDNELLPVKVAVVEYYKNADVRDLKPGEKTVATAGRGLKEAIKPLPASTGTDTDSAVDLAAAYVTFADKETGKDLGTFLLSQLASEQKFAERFAEKVVAGGQTYDAFLRFKREYKPYTLSLVDVRKDDYVASDTPRNYSSDVKVVDPEAGVDQTVHIKMNDPLRYRGDTLYQSGYHPLPDGEATTLSVVHNRGWMIPYVACMIVVIGMVAHFLITVTRFVSRREAEELASGDVVRADLAGEPQVELAPRNRKGAAGKPLIGTQPRKLDWSLIGLPTLAAGFFFLCIYMAARAPRENPSEMNVVRFGELPVAHQGRIKPIDTLARNSLRALSLRETVKIDTGRKLSATEWLLDVISGKEHARDYKVIRIDHPDILKTFDLKPRAGFLYSINELSPGIGRFEKQIEAVSKLQPEDMSVEQKKLLELDERLKLYITLFRSFTPPDLPRLPTEEQIKEDSAAGPRYMAALGAAVRRSADEMNKTKAPRVIPVSLNKDDRPEDVWRPYPVASSLAFMQQLLGNEPEPKTMAFTAILSAYADGDVAKFNREVSRYEGLLAKSPPPLWNDSKVDLEAYFNHFSPFFIGMPLYVLAFIIGLFGWLLRYKPLNWTAFTLILLTFCLHTVALGLRIYISGRPPVTNLYSSAVFIGWGAVLFGLGIEGIFRLGLGNIVSAVAGFATLQIAYLLASGGDTITVLQAVLDTQFWLATHVVCISLGYVATYLAGLFGLLYVIFGMATPMLDKSMRKNLGRIIYGVVCFAILFSFFGTVLGGLWADDSWGRFWGWDPKENGALIIVLWNALVLHARWDKMVGDRGLAVLAIGGNIVTSWSWFGVNELGIGLHSYGFTEGVILALGCFVLSQLAVMGAGMIPTQLWWSFRADEEASRLGHT